MMPPAACMPVLIVTSSNGVLVFVVNPVLGTRHGFLYHLQSVCVVQVCLQGIRQSEKGECKITHYYNYLYKQVLIQTMLTVISSYGFSALISFSCNKNKNNT